MAYLKGQASQKLVYAGSGHGAGLVLIDEGVMVYERCSLLGTTGNLFEIHIGLGLRSLQGSG